MTREAKPAPIAVVPIGRVIGGRTAPIDDEWGDERCVIELDARFGPESLAGLDGFSHLDVVFLFDRVSEAEIEIGARHPRGRKDWPSVGIFAQRAKMRPNRIGVSCCRLLRIEGTRLQVEGLDAIDGTPVLDIKPTMREFGPRGEVTQPAWATELMDGYYGSAARGPSGT
jgi:tRNA-Thr(GGU) m(6)t(6)A37 methyltransferase TsaA